MKKKSMAWLMMLGVLCVAALTLVSACGDDDDDDDDDDFEHGDDDASGDDDDASSPGDDCEQYAAEFFGDNGCFPDQSVYLSTLSLCDEIATSGSENVDDFFSCLAAINCDDFADLIELSDAIQICFSELPGF